MSTIRVGVLTISDRCSRNEAEDLSGPAIVDSLPTGQFVVAFTAIVPDTKKVVSRTLRRWADEFDLDVILTTGGTGLASRDITPEATASVIDREAANLAGYLLAESLKVTPFAALSRAIAGIRNKTLIVNLPGSPQGARQLTNVLVPLLSHAVSVLRDLNETHPAPKAQ